MIDQKVALVTGSTRGIGRAIALRLSREGYIIAVNGTSENTDVVEEIEKSGGRALFCRGDISDPEDRNIIFESMEKEFGQIDLLVNNTGVAPEVRTDILKTTEESFDRLMNINLKGPYFLTQAIAGWMIRLKETHKKMEPRIINISSVSAYTSSTSRGEYCISKAGLSMLTKLFADRLAEYDIPVFEIRPGLVATDMTRDIKEKYDKLITEGLTPVGRWGRPEDVARAVAAIAKGYFTFSTGEVINVDGGFHLRRL